MATEAQIYQSILDTPKSSTGVFELPCGYLDNTNVLHTEVELSEMTGFEEDMLLSRNVPPYRKIGLLLGKCLKRIGTIMDRGKMMTIVSDLLIGDRAFLYFALRRVSLGDTYPYKVECPACAKDNLLNINLSEVKTQKMSDPYKRIYDIELPSGKSARFHVMNGHDEERLSKMDNAQDKLSMAIQIRLELLDGKVPTLNDLKNLSTRDRNALREEFSKVEGGLDTLYEMSCIHCGHEWEDDIDPSQPSFLFPSTMKKNSRMKSSI